jgi:hypothetical protein
MPCFWNTEELAGLRYAIKMEREEERKKENAIRNAHAGIPPVEPQNSISQVPPQVRPRASLKQDG